MSINWRDQYCKVSKYFNVHECTWLPSWQMHYFPNDVEKQNIVATALKMDLVRELIGKPINVHCWIRPDGYNKAIGGAKNSAHIHGLAVDWDCHEPCDNTRKFLLPYLETLGMRMENLPKSSWLHLGNDWHEGMNHFFIP